MQVLNDKGEDVTEQFVLLSRRNVTQFVEGIDKFDRDTRQFVTVEAKQARNTRNAGRKDAVLSLSLDKAGFMYGETTEVLRNA